MTARNLYVILPLLAVSGVVPDAIGQTVRGYVSHDSITVGDRFQLIVVAEHAEGMDAVLPGMPNSSLASPSRIGELQVLGVASRGTRSFPGANLVVDSILFDVTAFGIDTVSVPPLPVLLKAGADSTVLFTDVIDVPVYSLVDEGRVDIEDLAPIADFPRPIWPWVLGGIVALGAAIAAILAMRRKTIILDPDSGVSHASPIEEARARLAQLRGAALENQTLVKLFFVELSDTLRSFLGRRLHIAALESTTAELVRELEALDLEILPDDVPLVTGRVLAEADLVKFADQHRTAETCREALEETVTLIEAVEESLTAGLEEGEELELAGAREDSDAGSLSPDESDPAEGDDSTGARESSASEGDSSQPDAAEEVEGSVDRADAATSHEDDRRYLPRVTD
jgi:hypothetical protein